jgi:hypothetical protein
MAMHSNQLDPEEVERRLDMASGETVTELLSLGTDILRELDERFEYLDSKATKIAGYSGAIVALIVSTIGTWPKAIDPRFVPVVLVAAMGALIAAGLALASTWPSELSTFSPNDWMRKELIRQPEELKKYWVSCIYANRQKYSQRCKEKAQLIEYSQFVLLMTAGMLLISLFDSAWSWGALLNRLRIG